MIFLCQSGTAEEERRGGLEEQDQQETGSGEGGVHRAAGSSMGDGADLPEEGRSLIIFCHTFLISDDRYNHQNWSTIHF